ncbi:MAG: hypothetical protein PHU27_05225 [Salinivirgaceae bacterium]|nr:hypothetical protein [Salinivirgaceae bacterium]MDD4747379.1 hypothetical protein [Salinivirgaceae bacterium]
MVKTNENFDKDLFKQELRKNSHSGLNTLNVTQFEEFAENRIAVIQNNQIQENKSISTLSGYSSAIFHYI